MTDWNAISAFLSAIVPWPGEPGPGYVNLHYDMPPDPKYKGKGGVPGWAFADIDAFLSRSQFALSNADKFKNQWFCLSMQTEHGGMNASKKSYKAKRSKANAKALRSIWIDCDVKPESTDGKHYTSEAEALKALMLFWTKRRLPEPTAIVHSGGGFHVYWANTVAMTPAEWRPYADGLKALMLADGLKCDYGLTTDAARLLRVPGSLNYKYDPPRKVKLLKQTKQYDFNTSTFQALKAAAPATTYVAPIAKPVHNIFADGVTAADFKAMNPKLAEALDLKEPRLRAGCERLVDPTPIFANGGCPFYREALKIGGEGHGQPLWHLAILGTTFMENGDVIAHKISEKHADYTPDGTDAMFSRKMAERDANRTLGYPSCATLKGAGCTACEGCPLFSKGKSPLNIRPKVTTTVTDTSSSSSSSEQEAASASETTVKYVPGNEVACRTALDKVVAADLSTFTSGDILTILRVPDQEKPGLERWGGDLPGTTPALAADIIERAERLKWMAPSGGKPPSTSKVPSGAKAASGANAASGGEAPSRDKGDEQGWKRCKPPRDFCTDYITQRRGRYAARLLVGIARVPFIRDDGTIRPEPGYDPETGIFVDRAPKLVVPDFPTLDDAKAAHKRVMKPFDYYKFEETEHGASAGLGGKSHRTSATVYQNGSHVCCEWCAGRYWQGTDMPCHRTINTRNDATIHVVGARR